MGANSSVSLFHMGRPTSGRVGNAYFLLSASEWFELGVVGAKEMAVTFPDFQDQLRSNFKTKSASSFLKK